MTWLSSAVLAAVALPVANMAQEIRLGFEFQVNSFTPSYQFGPAVAAEADGDIVVVWNSYEQDG